MASPLDGESTDPNMPAVNGKNGASRGLLAANDPRFNRSVGVYGESAANGIVGITASNTDSGVFGENDGTGDGVHGFSSKGHGVGGQSDTGIGVFSTCKNGHAIKGLQGGTGGGSGITPNPAFGAAVYGDSDFGYGVYGSSSSHDGVRGESNGLSGVRGISHRAETAGVQGENTAAGGLAAAFGGRVEISGNIHIFSGDIILSDFAEHFDLADVEIEPGTVVAIDEDGTLRPSNEPYDKKVAGVVSGAANFRPAIILGKPTRSDQGMPIALVGKVFCKVDADYSPVKVGDLLTTSATLGHAMKADDSLKAFGSVLGKALRSLKDGQGLIPILVTLQ